MLLDSGSPSEFVRFPNRRRAARREEDRRLLRRDRELQAARRISEALFQHLSMDDLAIRALQTALDIVEAESGSILLADPKSEQLIFRHSIGEYPVRVGTAISWKEGIAGEVFRSGTPIVIRDAKTDPRHFGGIDQLTGHVTHDLIALPLKRWEGDPIGVLEVLNKRGGTLDEDDLAILTIVSGIAAAAIEGARLFQEVKLAEVARLLGDIGHDIKNLLMPVVCGTGLLENEIKELLHGTTTLPAEKTRASLDLCREVIGMVRSSTQRIQDHVKQIADCVKGLSSPPQFAPCQIARLVESVYETLQWMATEKQVSLRADHLEKLPHVSADERRLFNAFYNLVNNALAEVPAGGSITVTGETSSAQNGVIIKVIDTGRGMPPEVCQSLFTPRVQSRKPGGTGLGTKIVKDVVDAHGGTITVQSTEGVGTTFSLFFPLQQPAAQVR